MKQNEILETIVHLYEIDIDNCLMTNKRWAIELSKALTDNNYLKELIKEHKEYVDIINQ
tara:strand:+ start:1082 stop:1258 length:177 start_codon:yes stop_codon:yes gene_type:complete